MNLFCAKESVAAPDIKEYLIGLTVALMETLLTQKDITNTAWFSVVMCVLLKII